MLEEMKKGILKGIVINKMIGDLVKGVFVYVVEDVVVELVMINDKGEYMFEVYEGVYMIKVVVLGYYSDEFFVDLKGDVIKEIVLKFFVGYLGEIVYDDGMVENVNFYFVVGNGWVVKMMLVDGKEKGMFIGGLFWFWDIEFFDSGGIEFKVEVYDVIGENGVLGKKIVGLFNVEVFCNGEWIKVDFSLKGIMVDKDFYFVYI